MIGQTLGHYRVELKLGEGGMGVVYKAVDTHLDRPVAIKVLPHVAVINPERKRRFVQEARAASALNHPNILHVYDIGTQEGVDYIVMEYVEGQTLDEVIAPGGLKTAPALDYATQIAGALAAAHAAGIVHRDIKPGNIMVNTAGLVKVLDFGLAKLREPDETDSQGITQTMKPRTEEGAILGTPAYMSPEQAEGRKVDARSDIFSFGAVLYEMLTGRRAFNEASKMATLSAILHKNPEPVGQIVEAIPPELERILARCLRKDPARRLQHMGDVKLALEELREAPPPPHTAPPPPPPPPAWLPWAVAALACVAVVALLWYFRRASPAEPTTRFAFTVEDTPELRGADLEGIPVPSPDGLRLAFLVVNRSGKTELWVRSLSSRAAVLLPGTLDAVAPFWSPDSRWIGFLADGKLKKVSASGGSAQTILELSNSTPSGFQGAWNQQGDIVFTRANRSPLYRVPESGGTPVQITTLDTKRGENSHRFPEFLPDGRHFLFVARCSQRENDALYLGSLDSQERRAILPIGYRTSFVPNSDGRDGLLLFFRDGTIFARQFRPENASPSGEPIPVIENVEYAPASRLASFSVAASGRLLVYRSGGPSASQFTWFDRRGQPLGTLGAPGERIQPRISLDGKRVLFSRPDDQTGNRDIWYLEVLRGTATRLTTNPANDWNGIWSPDGSRVVFGSDRHGGTALSMIERPLEAGGSETAVAGDAEAWPYDFSPDGRWIVYETSRPSQAADLWVMPLFGDRKPAPFATTNFSEGAARFSPDGRWIAYVSNESGRYEVYVRAFQADGHAGGVKLQISPEGGDYPVWSRDGKELFYITGDRMLAAVDTSRLSHSETVPPPVPLFRPCHEPGVNGRPLGATPWLQPFDIAPDGRFLFNCQAVKPALPTVVVNWQAELSRP
jgi:serine/threonine protein kinase